MDSFWPSLLTEYQDFATSPKELKTKYFTSKSQDTLCRIKWPQVAPNPQKHCWYFPWMYLQFWALSASKWQLPEPELVQSDSGYPGRLYQIHAVHKANNDFPPLNPADSLGHLLSSEVKHEGLGWRQKWLFDQGWTGQNAPYCNFQTAEERGSCELKVLKCPSVEIKKYNSGTDDFCINNVLTGGRRGTFLSHI